MLGLPNKKSSPLPRDFSEGCVLQRHAGAAGLPMASSEGVGEKMRYAPLAVERLGAAVFGFPADAAKPTRRERVSRRGPSRAGERVARALTQERAPRTVRRLPAGKPAAARGRPGERPPSFARPRRLPGHGKPSTASRSAAHSRAVKDHSNHSPFRLAGVWGRRAPGVDVSPRQIRQARACTCRSGSDPRNSLMRGMGGDRNQWYGQSTAAPVPSLRAPWGR